jgi:hypothetical protein
MKRLPVFAWLRAWYVALKDGEAIAGRPAEEARSSGTRTGGIHLRRADSQYVFHHGCTAWAWKMASATASRSDIRAFALAAVTLRFYERNARRCAWFRRRGPRPATPARARHSPTTRPNRDAARLCRFIGNTSAVWRSASVFQARRLGRLALLGMHLKVMKKCSETRRQRLLYCVVFDPETLPDYKQRSPL